jgi:GDPmannose 4,6-dehydratase
MWQMLQQERPDDYVIATGEQYSVRTFVELAFKHVGIEIIWEGSGLQEVGKDKSTSKIRVRVDERYYRPAEVETLLGDASKAKEKLGWSPKINTQELLTEMMDYDLKEARREKHIQDGGFKK